jgi:hypothetical protein
MPWRTITAKQYVDNSDPDGFDEARIECPDGRIREVWDASLDEGGDAVVICTSMPTDFAVTLDAPIRVR